MKTNDLLLLVAAGALLYVATRRRAEPQRIASPQPEANPEPVAEPATEPGPSSDPTGLALTEHGFALKSWDRWMALGPAGFDAAFNEGRADDPEEMMIAAFSKLYPDQEWPPQWGEARYGIWQRILQSIASSGDQGHRQGLRVVDHS